jgi:hypothetical protein
MRTLAPARACDCVLMLRLPRGVDDPARVLPRTSAVGVDANADAGADGGAGLHLSLRPVGCRGDRCRCLRRRGPACGWSSSSSVEVWSGSAPGAAVRVELRALAGADARLRAHLRISFIRRAGPGRCPRPRGDAWSCSRLSPGGDGARAVSRRGPSARRWRHGPVWWCSSPAPGSRRVGGPRRGEGVVIAVVLRRGGWGCVSRTGRACCRCLRGCSSPSSSSLLPVGGDRASVGNPLDEVAAVAGPDLRCGVHGSLLSVRLLPGCHRPRQSVSLCRGRSCRRPGTCRSLRRRGRACGSPSYPPVQPGPELSPCGQMPGPSPARILVLVSIAVSSVSRGRWGRCRCLRGVEVSVDLHLVSGHPPPASVNRRRGRRAGIRRSLRPRGCVCWCASPFSLSQPGPEPPWGHRPLPSPAWTWVVAFISASRGVRRGGRSPASMD